MLGLAAEAQERCFRAYDRSGRELTRADKAVTTICVGEEILFRACQGIDADKEYYDFDHRDGINFETEEATKKRYTFTEPGLVTVTQYSNLNGEYGTYEYTFNVVDTPAPSYTVTACANNKLLVNITDTHYDYYSIKYGDGGSSPPVIKNPEGATITYTYRRPGPYSISVTGRYLNGFCTSAETTIKINALPAYTPPVIAGIKTQTQHNTNGTIDFTFANLMQGYTYRLQAKTTAETEFTTIATLNPGQTGYALQNQNSEQPIEFRLVATDACGSILPASGVVTNIPITVNSGNEQATINWQGGPFQQYELYRNNTLLQTLNGNVSTFTDTGLTCGQQYCYTIKGITANGETTSQSIAQCIVGQSTVTPDGPTLLASFNLQNEVILTLQLPDGQTLQTATYQRSLNGNNFTDLANGTQTTLTDTPPLPQPVCYRASFTNPCDRTSEWSASACPVILSATLTATETAQLTWSNYSGFADGVAGYTLEVLGENGAVLQTIPVRGNDHSINLQDHQEQFVRYRIKATSRSGIETYSNTEVLELTYKILLPNAFTPNGDGLNDVFEAKGKRFTGFSMQVINRTGAILYTSDNIETGWNGTYKGQPQPAGVYTYQVTVTLQDGTIKQRTGTVNLLR